MKKGIWIALLSISITACQGNTGNSEGSDKPVDGTTQVVVQGSVTNLDPAGFEQKMQQEPGTLVDVRTPGEFSGGHLDGAMNIDYNGTEFDAEAEKLDKTKPVYVYCQKGGRSAGAAEILSRKGYKVVNMTGGYSAWMMRK